jgi:hypothetical protein
LRIAVTDVLMQQSGGDKRCHHVRCVIWAGGYIWRDY